MVHEIKIGPRGDTKIQREKEREREKNSKGHAYYHKIAIFNQTIWSLIFLHPSIHIYIYTRVCNFSIIFFFFFSLKINALFPLLSDEFIRFDLTYEIFYFFNDNYTLDDVFFFFLKLSTRMPLDKKK